MICIYKIENKITDKSYIGQTINFNDRISYYKYLRCKSQRKIYNSIKKYGFNNHVIEVLQECLENQLDKLETFYIEKYNTYNNGLNLTKGGKQITQRGKKFPEEWKEKMRKPKNLSNQQRKIISERVSKTNKGKPKTEEWKKNMSEKKKKKVIQFDLNNNELKIWNSISEASKVLNISATCISECLNNKQKTAKGYVWKYY